MADSSWDSELYTILYDKMCVSNLLFTAVFSGKACNQPFQLHRGNHLQ